MKMLLSSVAGVVAVAAVWAAEVAPDTCFQPDDGNAVSSVVVSPNAAVRRTVAFLGGSITEMNGFRPRVMRRICERFPNVEFREVAAGLSSTCSDTGAFRLRRDVLDICVPDLFIVESAVNDDQDGHFDLQHCVRGLEGIVRQVLTANPKCRIVIGLMVNRRQFKQIEAGEIPIPYAAARNVAAHYGAVVADVGTALVKSAAKGGMTWERYRNCHPSPEGCDFVADVVEAAVLRVFDPANEPEASVLPPPIDPLSYFNVHEIPLHAVKGDGWLVSQPDWRKIPGSKRPYFVNGYVLSCGEADRVAEVPFRGTALAALVTAGPDSGDLEVSVDGGLYRRLNLRAYYGSLHYPHTAFLADDLADGEHTAQFRSVPAKRNGLMGTIVRIHRLYANGSDPRALRN